MGNKTKEVDEEKEKILVLLVEGETEEEFYHAVITSIRKEKKEPFPCKVIVKPLYGIGNFKNRAARIFEKKLLKDNPNAEFTVLLCIDTDVFELNSKPPIKPLEVKKTLLDLGVQKVEFIKAKQCIEDWFLIDLQGILKYLKLSKSTKVTPIQLKKYFQE